MCGFKGLNWYLSVCVYDLGAILGVVEAAHDTVGVKSSIVSSRNAKKKTDVE